MPITPLFAAIFALMYIVLSFGVIRKRFSERIILGTQDNHELEKAVRIHSNFIEYVPMALILFWFVERIALNSDLVFTLGCVLLVARIGHVIGMKNHQKFLIFRQLGVLATFGVLFISALYLIWWYLPISV